jgi:hypothetical protein
MIRITGLENGDAAFLETGTPVYSIRRYSPEFRLAVLKGTQYLIYEADTNPQAKRGSDLLDIEGKVISIGIKSNIDGKTELASIKDENKVAELVRMVLDAPVDQTVTLSGSKQYILVFNLQDGTVVRRSYWLDTGVLLRGIRCPEEFGQGIKAAIAETKPASITSSQIPLTTVPEAEMTHIIFSLDWVLENDALPEDPFTVKISFPAAWVNSSPPVPEGEKQVELRVPLVLLNDHNESRNPDEITVVFPTAYFKGLPDPSNIPGTPSPQLIIEPPGINFFTPPGVNPPAENLEITAISGPLDWSLTSETSWLTLSSGNGTAIEEKQIVTVSADTAGLSSGIYTSNLIFRRAGTDWSREIPIRLFLTNAAAGRILDVPVEAGEGTAYEEGIKLGESSIMIGQVDRGPKFSLQGGGYYSAGDLCLVVQGEWLNTTGDKVTVDFWAEGYYAGGQKVAWTIDAGPLSGIVQKDVPGQSARNFEVALSWAENVRLIKVICEHSSLAGKDKTTQGEKGIIQKSKLQFKI